MLLNKSKILSGLAMGLLLCGIGTAQQAAAPQWKDRAEYDLVEEIKKASGEKKIELLNQWKQKYPETDFKTSRLGMYIGAYQQLNKPKGRAIPMEPSRPPISWKACSTTPR